jgi:malate/lactate dehydrogenase
MEFQTKEVTINGNTFHIKELSARQRKEMYQYYKDERDPVDVQAFTIQAGCEECKGMTPEQILDMPGTIFGALSDEIIQVSGLADNAEGEAEKNS